MKTVRLTVLLAISGFSCHSQPVPSFTLTNEGESITINLETLMSLPYIEKELTGHEQQSHLYRGVPLTEVLYLVHQKFDQAAIRENLNKYILVKAHDNYQVIYSATEVDPQFKEEVIFLAYQVDGKELLEHAGPFQMIVPGEKKHARWIREVKSISVLTIPEAQTP